MVEQTESEVETGGNEILVAVTEETAPAAERSLVDLAVDLARTREGGVRVAKFDEIPDQTPLPGSADTLTEADRAFEARLADALATAVGATITFYFPIGADPPESRRNTIQDYHAELVELCEAPVETALVESGTDSAVRRAATDSDVLTVSGTQGGPTDRLFGRGTDPVETGTAHGTFVVYGASQPGPLRRAVERRLF